MRKLGANDSILLKIKEVIGVTSSPIEERDSGMWRRTCICIYRSIGVGRMKDL